MSVNAPPCRGLFATSRGKRGPPGSTVRGSESSKKRRDSTVDRPLHRWCRRNPAKNSPAAAVVAQAFPWRRITIMYAVGQIEVNSYMVHRGPIVIGLFLHLPNLLGLIKTVSERAICIVIYSFNLVFNIVNLDY